MKILHTSDWHLGRPITSNESYIDDQKYFFENLYRVIRDEHIDLVICAGDVYDSSVSNAEAINLYNEVTTNICINLHVPMVVIAGNHDSGPRLASCRELLKGAGLHVTGRLSRDLSPVLFDDGKVAVYSLPYFNKDEVSSLFPEKKDELKSAESAMKAVCDIIRENMNPEIRNIVVSHSLIVNAEISESDHSAQIGLASAVSKDVFEKFDYVALGHIHKPQCISDTIRYSGSPVKYSFGKEEKQEKGVVVIDTSDMSQTFIPVEELHGRKTIEDTYEDIISLTGLENSYLSIMITDRASASGLFPELKKKFPFLLELRGKEYTMSSTGTSLSAGELEKLDERTIMARFLKDMYDFEPDSDQMNLFESALEESNREAEEN